MIKKILFSITALILSFNINAQANDKFLSGIDYLEEPTKDAIVISDKPVLIDFFWYGCGHCFAMKPKVKELIAKHQNKIVAKSYPATFDNWKSGAQIFFALEEMGVINTMHDKIFDEIHINKKNILKNENLLMETVKSNGVSADNFKSMYSSFTVQSKVNKAMLATKQLNIESTPYFVIYYKGKTYKTSPSMTAGYDKTIAVLDSLLTKFTK